MDCVGSNGEAHTDANIVSKASENQEKNSKTSNSSYNVFLKAVTTDELFEETPSTSDEYQENPHQDPYTKSKEELNEGLKEESFEKPKKDAFERLKDEPAETKIDIKQESPERKIEVLKFDQAGGHSGRLVPRGDKIYKIACVREHTFYQYLFSQECIDSSLIAFRSMVPHYYGTEVINGQPWLVLENLLIGYEHPNLLDCKMGRITWTSDHPERKATSKRIKSSKTTSGILGFRITGLLLQDNQGQVRSVAKDKKYYKSVENLPEYFQRFAEADKTKIQSFVDQTERILAWFKGQTSKVFYTASLFCVNGKNGKVQTRFIDLSYVYDAEGRNDENVIEGLESVVGIWKGLL